MRSYGQEHRGKEQPEQEGQTTTDKSKHDGNINGEGGKKHEEENPEDPEKEQQTEQHTQQANGKRKDAEDEAAKEKRNNEESMGESGKGNTDKNNNATEDYLGEYCKIPKGKGKERQTDTEQAKTQKSLKY